MTTQYDTEYLNSLSIPELETLMAKIIVVLVKYHGMSEENISFLKEAQSFGGLTFFLTDVTLH